MIRRHLGIKPEPLWKITLWCSSHAKPPRVRIVARSTRAEAVDSAKRELRRIRNTDEANRCFDRWELRMHNYPTAFAPKVAEGTAEGL